MTERSPVGLHEDVLQPESLLPEQFRHLWHQSAAASPTQRLALAVLLRAILDLSQYRFARRLRHQKLYADAYAWVFGRRVDESGLSFTLICDAFNIDANAARRELVKAGEPTAPERIKAVAWDEAA